MKVIRDDGHTNFASHRGYSLLPVNHDGEAVICLHQVAKEIFPGVFLTADQQSGIGLIETNPDVKTGEMFVQGKRILDVAQIGRGQILTVNGQEYAFLKYMDIYFNRAAKRKSPAEQEFTPTDNVVPTSVAHSNLVQMIPTAKTKQEKEVIALPGSQRRFRNILRGVTIVACAAAIAAVVFQTWQPHPANMANVNSDVFAKEAVAAAQPDSGKPQSLRELLEEDVKPVAPVETGGAPATEPKAEGVEAAVASVNTAANHSETADEVKKSNKNSNIDSKKAAIPSKRSERKLVQKEQKPRPAVASQPVNEAVLKQHQRDFEEAVLIRGYDRERSLKILEQLRKKVPANSSLRQKIDAAIRDS